MLECEEGVQFDQPVKVSKEDGHGQEDNVTRVFAKQPHELHDLGEAEHEDNFACKEEVSVSCFPAFSSPPARQEHEGIRDEGNGRESRDV